MDSMVRYNSKNSSFKDYSTKAQTTKKIDEKNFHGESLMPTRKSITRHDCSTLKVVKVPLPSIKSNNQKRQQTKTFISFRKQKSLSQIDMKQVNRSAVLNCSPLCDNRVINTVSLSAEGVNLHDKLFNSNLVGARIYATLMLNAWRKRRREVKELTIQFEKLKQSSTNAKNQLHLFKTLFSDEQKRNAELEEKIKSSNDLVVCLKESEAQLKQTLSNSEKKKITLEQQLLIKTQDHHALNIFFKQTKAELFKLMTQQQETQTQVEAEHQKVLELDTERQRLLKIIKQIEEDSRRTKENLQLALTNRETVIENLMRDFKIVSNELNNTKGTFNTPKVTLDNNEDTLKSDINKLQVELDISRRCLAATLGQRVKNCWNASLMMQRVTLHFAHTMAANILPAVPQAHSSKVYRSTFFPFNYLAFEKGINIKSQ